MKPKDVDKDLLLRAHEAGFIEGSRTFIRAIEDIRGPIGDEERVRLKDVAERYDPRDGFGNPEIRGGRDWLDHVGKRAL